ncbi:hypothetical protein LguiA_033964 [Lonicera macranthoides]
MVLWEITLGTAYFLGLKRTYRLALKIQRRLISPKRPRIRNFLHSSYPSATLVMIEMQYLEGSIKGENKVFLKYQVAVLPSKVDMSAFGKTLIVCLVEKEEEERLVDDPSFEALGEAWDL